MSILKLKEKVKVYVFIILLLIVIPSVFKFYNIIQESIFVKTQSDSYRQITIDNEIVLSEDNIILEYDEEAPKITLNIDGKYINSEIQAMGSSA